MNSRTSPGVLMLIGGATAEDTDVIFDELIAHAGNEHSRIGVVSAAGDNPRKDADEAIALLTARGAKTEWIPVTSSDLGSGDDPRHAAHARAMSGYLLTGGDQCRYIESMIAPDGRDGAVLASIRRRVAEGAPLAGGSAGMQILAGHNMITRGRSYPALLDGSRPGRFDTDETLGHWPAGGFGFVTSGLVDTHFDARGRHGRSIRLAADTGHARVYGVGEDTALVVTGAGTTSESMRVLGSTGVSILDLRSARAGEVDGHWSIQGVKWSYLTDGDTYAPTEWRVTKGAARFPVTPDDRRPRSASTDIFSPYALLDTALDLAAAGAAAETTGTTLEQHPPFVVTLTKNPQFTPYSANGASATSFTDLSLDICCGFGSTRGRSKQGDGLNHAQGNPDRTTHGESPTPACPGTPSLGKDGVMSANTSRRYPPELRERAVRMVAEVREDHGSDWAWPRWLRIGTTETLRKGGASG